MSRRIATGIDIGTYQVKVVVVEELADRNGGRQLRIIGTGLAESKGLRHGYIVNKEEVTTSITRAKQQAESTARVPIRSDKAPHVNEPMPMKSQLRSATVEMPVRDQPIASEIGARKTASENIAPSPMHVTTMPAATMTHP